MQDKQISILHEIIPALSLIIGYQQEQNLYHTWRVAIMATYLAEEIIPESTGQIFYAGLLHDIGIMGEKTEIDFYSLSISEQALIPELKNHPTLGAQIVCDIPEINEAAVFIQDHHEWWNGEGYPNSKKQDEISLGGQILRIADSFDLQLRQNPRHMTTDVYDYFRVHADREYSKKLWPFILEVKSKDAGRIFHELSKDVSLPITFEKILKNDIVTLPQVEPSKSNLEVVMRVLGRIVDAKDSYTQGHSERVAKYSEAIARKMRLSEEDVASARLSGFLHDVGKVSTPISILDKHGPLTKEEYEVMKRHAVVSMEIIDSVKCIRHMAPIAGHDQERYDGKGYPDGLKGDEIPLLARVLCVADAIDAMSSSRPYREPMDFETMIKELKINSGTQFDPRVAEAAIAYLHEEGVLPSHDKNKFSI